jgi:hypothetical protein
MSVAAVTNINIKEIFPIDLSSSKDLLLSLERISGNACYGKPGDKPCPRPFI